MSGRSSLPVPTGDGPRALPRDAVFAQRGTRGYALPGTAVSFDLSRSITNRTHRLIYNVPRDRRFAPVDIEDYFVPFWSDLRTRDREGGLGEPFDRLSFSPTRPMFELFDLVADPHELENLSGWEDVAPLEAELKARLAEWMITERDFVPLPTERQTG